MSEQRRSWRIAIIEDNAGDRAELKAMLLRGQAGRYEFLEAATGDAGLELCRTAPTPDCVVLDYELPDMNALGFLAEMKRENFLPALPVVILTGMDDSRVGPAVMRAGAQDFVGKDWLTPGSIRRAVENAVDRHHASLELARRSERQSLLLALTTRILAGYSDQASLLSSIGAQIAQHLKAETACACIAGADGALAPAWGSGLDMENESVAFCAEPDGCEDGVWRDADALAAHPHGDLLRKLGVKAWFSYRLQGSTGDTLAVFSFGAASRDSFSVEEREFVQTICQTLTVAFERGQAESALRERDQRLRLAGEAAGIGFWSWDSATGQVTLDATCATLLGLPPDGPFPLEVLLGALHPEDRPRLETAGAHALETLGRYDTEFRVRRPDGGERWLIGLGHAIHEVDAAARLTGVTWDITERKSSESERARLLESERLARLNAENEGRLKDEFLATLSHELRTPLSAILGWTHIMGDEELGKDELQYGLQVIKRNAQVQAQLIEDLLDMSRIICGKVRLEMRQIEAAEVVEAALETVTPAAEARGVHLLNLSDPSGALVLGDAGRLQQVVWNLLSNAVKFTPRDGTVTVGLSQAGSHVEITVSDSGAGISPEFLPHVFDRFRQADGSVNRDNGGLGLGLSIVRHLVELHGGTVRAASAGLGHGSAFTVCLPLAAVRTPGAGSAALAEGSERSPALTPAQRLQGVRVLVVDDIADSREVVRHFLAEQGALVSVASSVATAIASLKEYLPDVLITDIGMPGEDGYELLRQLRSLDDARSRYIPAIALTAFASPADRQKALEAGFQQHAAKPVEPGELVDMVATLARAGTERAG